MGDKSEALRSNMAALNNKRPAKRKLATGNFKRVTANSSLLGFPVSHEKPDDYDYDDDYYFCKNLLSCIAGSRHFLLRASRRAAH